MVALWLPALVVGIAGAAAGSRRAVTGALAIADGLGVSKGLVGVTLVALGTDLPEIATRISASVTGRADLNVGDSTGASADAPHDDRAGGAAPRRADRGADRRDDVGDRCLIRGRLVVAARGVALVAN